MTAEDVIAAIKSRGYWRVSFRPVTPEDRFEGVSEALRTVQAQTVSLRGWDYPHMPGGDHSADTARLQGSFRAWTDWASHKEFWAIFTSSQFLHLKAVRTDWLAEDQFNGNTASPETENVLGVIDNLWHVAESFEFLSRLAGAGCYKNGCLVEIALFNTVGRKLYVDERTRSSFYWDRVTQDESITFREELSRAAMTDPKELTRRAMKIIFDPFGWEVPVEMLNEMIDQLYGLNIGRG